jgi:succinoglycan biosynthesis protein ExoM
MNAVRENHDVGEKVTTTAARRRKAVVVTNSIPGHDVGFARSGHAHYFGTFLEHLVDRGFETVSIVIAPRFDSAMFRADALPYRVASRDLKHIGGYLVVVGRKALVVTATWLVFSRLPRPLQRVGAAVRTLLRKRRGYAHVLGNFLTDADRAYVAEIVAAEGPDLVIYDGIFHACGSLSDVPHWILTHEVKFERARSFAEQGVGVLPDGFSPDVERRVLNDAGNIIAIQWDDANAFRRLVPQARIVVVPVTIEPPTSLVRSAVDGRCIFVGSGSFHNVDGIRWFLDECWPLIRRSVPHAVLDIFGTVCYGLENLPAGVVAHGVVDDLTAAYSTAALAVVPLRMGSGLKVKLVEALAHELPSVTTSVGAQGVASLSPSPFLIADEPAAFAERCIRALTSTRVADELSAAAHVCAKRFTTAAAFADFDRAIVSEGGAAVSSIVPRVCIAVPTYRRSAGLARLLNAIADQAIGSSEAEVEVVVLDNDPGRSAETIVNRYRSEMRFPLHYEQVAQAGLSIVRNRALAFAAGRFDYLAMIDDDEVPEAQWLGALLEVARQSGSEVVVGPVFPVVPESAPQWIAALRARETPIHRNGALIRDGWSCNALVSLAAVARTHVAFDPALNFAGGEDQLFFRQLGARGATIAFAAEARVHESLAADRLTIRFCIRREFRRGNSLAFCERRLDGSMRTPVIRTAKALAFIARGLLRMALTLGRDEGAVVREACEVARGCGMLTGLAGRLYQAYGRTN